MLSGLSGALPGSDDQINEMCPSAAAPLGHYCGRWAVQGSTHAADSQLIHLHSCLYISVHSQFRSKQPFAAEQLCMMQQ